MPDPISTENLLRDLQGLGVKVFIADMPHYDGNNRKGVLIRQVKESASEGQQLRVSL